MSRTRTLGQHLLALFIALQIASLFEIAVFQTASACATVECPDYSPCAVVLCPQNTTPTVIPPANRCSCATCECIPNSSSTKPTLTTIKPTTTRPVPTTSTTCSPVYCPLTVCSGPCTSPLVPTSSPVPCGCPKCGCGLPPRTSISLPTIIKPTSTTRPCPTPPVCPLIACVCPNNVEPIWTYPYCKCPVCSCPKPTLL